MLIKISTASFNVMTFFTPSKVVSNTCTLFIKNFIKNALRICTPTAFNLSPVPHKQSHYVTTTTSHWDAFVN